MIHPKLASFGLIIEERGTFKTMSNGIFMFYYPLDILMVPYPSGFSFISSDFFVRNLPHLQTFNSFSVHFAACCYFYLIEVLLQYSSI